MACSASEIESDLNGLFEVLTELRKQLEVETNPQILCTYRILVNDIESCLADMGLSAAKDAILPHEVECDA